MTLHVYNDDDLSGDLCSKEGAKKLKEKIEAYWRARGFEIQIVLKEEGFVPSMRSRRADVRSNLVNGLPPALARSEQRAA